MVNFFINIFVFGAWLLFLAHLFGQFPQARRYRKLLVLFFLGGIASIFVLNWIQQTPLWLFSYGLTYGNDFMFFVFNVGLFEEGSKFLVLLLLFKLTKPLDEPRMPLFLALSLGAGFGIAENLLYYWWVDPAAMVIRSLSNGHGLYTTISAAFFTMLFYPSIFGLKKMSWWTMPGGFGLAMLSHGIFNTLCGIPMMSIFLDLASFLFMLRLVDVMGKASPGRPWALGERKRAISHLQESLAQNSGSSRNRLRLAIYLVAGQSGDRAVKAALGQLGQLNPRVRQSPLVALLISGLECRVADLAGRTRLRAEMARRLAETPALTKALAETSDMVFAVALDRNQRQARGRAGRSAWQSGLNLQRLVPGVFDKALGVQMRQLLDQLQIPVSVSALGLAEFKALEFRDWPPALEAALYQARSRSAWKVRERRIGLPVRGTWMGQVGS